MQKFCCFIVFLCQYIHSFIFPEMAGRGGTAPLATPLNPPLHVAKLSMCAVNNKSSIVKTFVIH